jgi:SAM-dependent methyltransferase
MYWDDVEKHIGQERLSQFWLANDDVRRHVNRLVTGSPEEWPFGWFARQFRSILPLDRCAVIGCGTGALERFLVKNQIAREVVAIDVASGAVGFAESEAIREGVEGSIRYFVAEAIPFLREHPDDFDAVFFHGALHHLSPVSEVLQLTKAAMKSSGILYLDEYVGPSMRQWNWWRLAPANLAYYLAAPHSLRRPRLVRAPRNPDDPTEMIDSASILPEVRRQFRVLAERGYGGNILALVYPNFRHDVPEELLRRTVSRLLAIERYLARLAGHHYVVVVAQK